MFKSTLIILGFQEYQRTKLVILRFRILQLRDPNLQKALLKSTTLMILKILLLNLLKNIQKTISSQKFMLNSKK